MDDHREVALQKLLSTYIIDSKDSQLIQKYCDYLVLRTGRLPSYLFLLKNGFLKKDIIFRLTTLYRILFTMHYEF